MTSLARFVFVVAAGSAVACGGSAAPFTAPPTDAIGAEATSDDAASRADTAETSATDAPATTDGAAGAEVADAGVDAGCTSCLRATGSYDGVPTTFECDFPPVGSTPDAPAYVDVHGGWFLRCTSTDGRVVVGLAFDTYGAPGAQDFKGGGYAGVNLWTKDPTDPTRYCNSDAPSMVRDHVEWDSASPGRVRGRFEGSWSNLSDGNPYGDVKGTFVVGP